MIIKRSPVFSEGILAVSRSEDILTLNGVSFDFTDLAEGGILPRDAVSSEWLVSDVTRKDGSITLTIRWPHTLDAGEADRFPEPFTPSDGEVGTAGRIDWTKLSTAADREASALAEWRALASASRRNFCMGLYLAGVLSKGDAIIAARGDWPTAFNAFLTDLTEGEAVAAQIEWASAQRIHRAHPIIDGLASMAGLTPEQVDGLFAS